MDYQDIKKEFETETKAVSEKVKKIKFKIRMRNLELEELREQHNNVGQESGSRVFTSAELYERIQISQKYDEVEKELHQWERALIEAEQGEDIVTEVLNGLKL